MKQVHLLVACHGMWGNPIHLAELARHAREKFAQEDTSEGGAELVVLVAQTNRDFSTYDGIDWGGERIADEASPK
jgi:HD-like signal output (HDOD) protein